MKHLLFISIFSLICHFSMATETDNFTRRNIDIDAREWLNRKMNQAIQKSIKGVKGPDYHQIHQQLFKDLGGLLWANIELWSKDRYSPAIHLPFEESIFRDVGDAVGDKGWRKRTKFREYYTSGLYRIGDVVFGDDKLGHFLQLGYAMYFATRVKENPKYRDARSFHVRIADQITGDAKFVKESNLHGDDLVHAFSKFQEDGEWGYEGPMARSYGDIAANWEGYKFWSDLAEGNNPYVRMNENGRWEQVREFDWGTYVNPAWDESVNFSDYHTRIKDGIDKRINEFFHGPCPINVPACRKIAERYGDATRHILNPICVRALSK